MRLTMTGLGGGLLLAGLLALPLQAQEKKIPVTSHDVAGKENCLMCHAIGIMPPVPDVPADHRGRGNETCQWCHAADSPMQKKTLSPVSHDFAGKENCLMCHAIGIMPPVPDIPADHRGRANATCTWCHKPKGGV